MDIFKNNKRGAGAYFKYGNPIKMLNYGIK